MSELEIQPTATELTVLKVNGASETNRNLTVNGDAYDCFCGSSNISLLNSSTLAISLHVLYLIYR
jgi:Na+-transporting NADH:ubiquinone oxidoreductase subunit NqrB